MFQGGVVFFHGGTNFFMPLSEGIGIFVHTYFWQGLELKKMWTDLSIQLFLHLSNSEP